MDAALTSLLNQGSAWVLGGARPRRRGNRHPSIAPYETYEAADRPLAIAAGNDRLFARLCEALGLPDLPADERFATNTARVEHIDELAEALESVLRTQPAGTGSASSTPPACRWGRSTASTRRSSSPSRSGWPPSRRWTACPSPARRSRCPSRPPRCAAARRGSTSTATRSGRGSGADPGGLRAARRG